MKRIWWTLLFVTALGTFAVQAQTAGSEADRAAPAAPARPKGTGLLNENYLAPTGDTLPHPGLSQGAPTSSLDRMIERENNRLDQSICSNCN